MTTDKQAEEIVGAMKQALLDAVCSDGDSVLLANGFLTREMIAEYLARAALAAARPLIEADTREMAARIADDHAKRAWDIASAEGQNAVCGSGRNHGARAIAQAIRSMGSSDRG